jgi:hypothetical protein
MPKQPPTGSVTVEFEGKKYTGSYHVASKVVTVRYLHHLLSTQLGGMTGEQIAKILLREIVENAKAGGEV